MDYSKRVAEARQRAKEREAARRPYIASPANTNMAAAIAESLRLAKEQANMEAAISASLANAGSKRPIENSAIAASLAVAAPVNAGVKRPIENNALNTGASAIPAPAPPAPAPAPLARPAPLSMANATAIANMNEFLNRYQRLENIQVNLPLHPYSATPHPGYQKITTNPDGDCMYYAIYFAIHPDEDSSYGNQTPDKALQIREMVAANATINDAVVFGMEDLEDSIRKERNRTKKQELLVLRTQLRDILKNPDNASFNEDKLAIYRRALLHSSFWGQEREIQIFNRISAVPIYIWDASVGRYLFYIQGGAPIHYNGSDHYSILKPIGGQENQRAAQNTAWQTYDRNYAAANARQLELRAAFTAKYPQGRPSAGGKRRTRKSKKSKKRGTRRH